jgi:hypothetical protein
MYFLKLVCTESKHRQSGSVPAYRRPDTRWVPKQNAKILHSIKKKTFFSLDSFQFHIHTALRLSQWAEFLTYKNTLIELGLIFCYVLCPVMFLHPATTAVYIVVFYAGNFLKKLNNN